MDIEKLPKTIEIEMFIILCIGGYNAGNITTWRHDTSIDDDDEVLLGTQMVTFNIPQDVDIKGRAIQGLEDKKSKLQAKHHMELKAVQDKIDNLLAIEYKPEEE